MFLLFASLLLTGVASAQSDADIERAKVLFNNGSELYEEGRYEDAIVAWEEAYKLSNEPALLYNIANAQERLGRYQEAYDTLNRYRAYASEGERESIERRLVNLEARLREQPATTTTPPPKQDPPPPDKGGGGDSLAGALVLPAALYGVGLGGLGVGVGFGIRAKNARSEALLYCTLNGVSNICTDGADDALARDRSSSLIADIGFAAGAAGLVGGTAALFLGRSSSSGDLSVSPAPNGLVVSGRF